MGRLDWMIVSFLILIGLLCLTMSATWIMNPTSLYPYLHTFLTIGFWIVVPTMVVILILIKVRRRKDK